MAAKPVVDGIEREHSRVLAVVRLNVQDAAGRAWAERLQVVFTPTFLFFDAGGREVWRSVGAIDPARVRSSLAAP
jgi:hypothetical protein